MLRVYDASYSYKTGGGPEYESREGDGCRAVWCPGASMPQNGAKKDSEGGGREEECRRPRSWMP